MFFFTIFFLNCFSLCKILPKTDPKFGSRGSILNADFNSILIEEIRYNPMDVNLKRVDVNLRTHLFLKFENEYHVNLSSHVIQKKDE